MAKHEVVTYVCDQCGETITGTRIHIDVSERAYAVYGPIAYAAHGARTFRRKLRMGYIFAKTDTTTVQRNTRKTSS